MELTGARVSSYRSVEDSEEFRVEPDVTALVGKNESGKTNLLRVLYRMRPVEPSAGFDEVIDYPARLTRQRKQAPADQLIPVVEASFRLNDAELAAIEADLGVGALKSREFTVAKGYRDDTEQFDIDCDEAAITAHLRTKLDQPSATAPAIAQATKIQTLLEGLDALGTPEEIPAAAQALASRIRGWRGQDVALFVIDEYISPKIPKFVYFDDYDAMPGKVSIPDLIARRDGGTITRGERALLSLLSMAGIRPEDFQETAQHERLIRELENAGNVISDEVFEYWSQSDELEVKLEILPPESGATPPLDQGPILQIRVHNRRHRASVPFDERSRGFVWFFSFLAYFNELEEGTSNDLVILLDEPGLSLHACAQKDFLRLIDERLAPKHQVLYTTHSPFMVSPGRLHRVRTVIDHDRAGTKVSEDIFRADEDTAFPLLTAMGIEMTQTLFVGEHTLLLEGPSDLIYLDVLSEAAEAQGLEGLDPRWVKTPVGGAGKLSTFVTLLGANKLHVAVLTDSSTKDTGAVQRLRDNGQLTASGLVQVGEFTGTADADIEDLFAPAFYLELVNRAYRNDITQPITADDLNPNDPRIVRQVEAVFKKRNLTKGRFNHYRPAATLLREQANLFDRIDAATALRAGKLFTRLNALLP
ncbi:AAA family ATPase [Streptomyces sp. NPDC049585]|uniref:AAA family ATPase n=1 Tax=Streptomyces sp. NPDC049585 TaxID=3155154 RepID=UPI003444C248